MTVKVQTHYRVSELKELGWTDKLIEKYLVSPDKLVKNPVYSSKSPMRLFLIERVESVTREQQLQDILQANLQKRDKRSQSAIVAANAKRRKILEYVESLHIEIPQYEYPKLVELACRHYNDLHFARAVDRGYAYDFREADVHSDSDFLYRIIHNFLRHEETKYEYLIETMFGQVGKQEAYEALKSRITAKINFVYPELMKILESR